MKERLTIFAVGFAVSLIAIMFFLHFRKVHTGESGIIKRMINEAGEVGTITTWIEADTFVVDLPGERTTVRLNGVDAPGPQFPGGRESLGFIQNIVDDNHVRVLEFRRNSAGEIIGEVYNRDNVSLNEELMKAGWAWFYEPDSKKNPYYRELNDRAMAEERGLWSLPETSPPWESVPRNTAP